MLTMRVLCHFVRLKHFKNVFKKLCFLANASVCKAYKYNIIGKYIIQEN